LHDGALARRRASGAASIATLGVLALVLAILFFGSVSVKRAAEIFLPRGESSLERTSSGRSTLGAERTREGAIIPIGGVDLGIRWGDIGARLVEAGVIARGKFEELYASDAVRAEEARRLLAGGPDGSLRITRENAPIILNLLWAFGLGNKSSVLETGPMRDPSYGGADIFASTGGWTLSKDDPSDPERPTAMDHYSMHAFVTLTAEQQKRVEDVSKNIFRPCCNNATYFPDCNHGMAMLGLLELLAAQGANGDAMYRSALAANSYWFPDTYLTIDAYLAKRGRRFEDADPKELLGAGFSSASGFQRILREVEPASFRGGSCGV
ncbi:MAG: hypothetical protein HY536_01455, partial [Candidatus Colwellbacteria bacterium]|nr:hypothetical protein [Candidatus Colwellbacteria bacterium]